MREEAYDREQRMRWRFVEEQRNLERQLADAQRALHAQSERRRAQLLRQQAEVLEQARRDNIRRETQREVERQLEIQWQARPIKRPCRHWHITRGANIQRALCSICRGRGNIEACRDCAEFFCRRCLKELFLDDPDNRAKRRYPDPENPQRWRYANCCQCGAAYNERNFLVCSTCRRYLCHKCTIVDNGNIVCPRRN